MEAMVRRWGTAAMAAGVVALSALLLLVVVAASLESAPYEEPLSATDGPELPQAFSDPNGAFTLFYPYGWQAEPLDSGVAIWPPRPGNDFADRGAAFYVYIGDPLDQTENPLKLPLALIDAIKQSNTVREAANVAVGGLSGEERVTEVMVTDAIASQLDSSVGATVRLADGHRLTLVSWQTSEQGKEHWVLMVDARDGQHVVTLEEMRDSLTWKECASCTRGSGGRVP